MNDMDERVETAFCDEYTRMKHDGIDKLLEQRLDKLLFQVYRRGYIRGHSDRSREVKQAEEQALREGRGPGGLSVKYDGDRLYLGGREVSIPKD